MKVIAVLFCLLVIVGCEKFQPKVDASKESDVVIVEPEQQELVTSLTTAISKPKATLKEYETIEWDALIPEADLEALLNPPDYIVNIADGSAEDRISNALQDAMNTNQQHDDVYEQALISTDVIESMNGKKIRIPGFVVPVEFTEEQRITSFFLVPYFGACLHMPPPPPNQIIYVRAANAFELVSLYEPVWVSGTLSTAMFEDPVATSAYIMDMVDITLYYEE